MKRNKSKVFNSVNVRACRGSQFPPGLAPAMALQVASDTLQWPPAAAGAQKDGLDAAHQFPQTYRTGWFPPLWLLYLFTGT